MTNHKITNNENVKWATVRFPIDSKSYQKMQQKNIAAWAVIEEIVTQLPETKEKKVEKEFDKFMDFTEDLYPGSKRKLDMLKPIILNKILRIWSIKVNESYNELPDAYFEHLKEALNSDEN